MKLYAGTSGYSVQGVEGLLLPGEDRPPTRCSRSTRPGCPRSRSTTRSTGCRSASCSRAWAAQVPPGLPLRHQGLAEDHAHEAPQERGGRDQLPDGCRRRAGEEARRGVLPAPAQLQEGPRSPRRRSWKRCRGRLPVAFEFRHATWFEDAGVSICSASTTSRCASRTPTTTLEVPLVSTADWGYLRLRRPGYTADRTRGVAEMDRRAEVEGRLRVLQARGRGGRSEDGDGVPRAGETT